jgi:excisionase family DNA binding protein
VSGVVRDCSSKVGLASECTSFVPSRPFLTRRGRMGRGSRVSDVASGRQEAWAARPTLVRLLESGKIPFEQPGRHRRVRLADVLAYQERAARHRAAGLDQMVADAEDAGLYDLPSDVPFERLPTEDGGE